jgi:hypothetical protein
MYPVRPAWSYKFESVRVIVRGPSNWRLVRSLFVAEDETLTTVIWKVPSWLVMQPDGGGDVGAILSVTP